MAQRDKKKLSTLSVIPNWDLLCLDCWVCRGCDKRCCITTSQEPRGCKPEYAETNKEKATLKMAY